MIDLLTKLIEFKTVDDFNEFERLFAFIKDYLKSSNLYFNIYNFNGKTSLVIANTKTKDFDIIFCGHVDVVPGNNKQFIPYIENNRLYGRGSFDMKGHDAVMIEIMRNLNEINTSYKVALFLTSDEEQGGFLGTNKLLNKMGYYTKLAIIPDAGNDFSLIQEEKGVLQFEICYKGTSSHASTPWNGDNALSKLMNVYQKLIKRYPLPKNKNDYITSINLGYLNGGDVINRVCDYAKMGLDIRHIKSDTKKSIINEIKKIASDIEINVLKEGIEFSYIENDLSKKYLNACKQILKRDIVYESCESSSDARFFYEKGISCILMNAEGNDMHGDNEYIDLNSLNTLYQIYEKFLKDAT